MLASLTHQKTFSVNLASRSNVSSGISRVFAAAVVNQQFRDMLLHDPNTALQKGYLGETFLLNKEEQDLIISIRACSLSDLAKQVNRALQS